MKLFKEKVVVLISFVMMQSLKKYSACLLVLIFIFPIFFQAGHRFVHIHEHEQEHRHCTSGCHQEQSNSNGLNLETPAEECLVCEYEFTTFHVQPSFSVHFYKPWTFHSLNIAATGQPHTNSQICLSLRAPPAWA
ncbi:hypothetical protein [Sunxiuqinia elliptica]|uniref:Uncharacterized protein n=1 Tax=Sunxiuqinia elliptica TaxID=655355 RepID=A0A4R6H910_9BACT|nr:hypothetical protein [Sunxiuqinia elliptica]TDO04055.1 hypothetical protein DET52_102395 [Sunxiuqinia elliptica]TDO62337.1 hypothetical protein DET65_2072 [Sunxiuqinia elliptica]